MYWLLAIVLVLVLTAVVSTAVFYVMFRSTPEGAWRGEVLRRRGDAVRLRDELVCELDAAPRHEAEETLAMTGRAFQHYLRSIPVSALGDYPGIGPVTVERLQREGYRYVDELSGARLSLPGLGPGRIADLNAAMRQLTESARRRFDAGACREAHALAAELDGLRRRRISRESEARAQLLRVDAFLAALRPAVEGAEAMSFWNYLHEQFFVGAESEYQDIIETPMPELNDFLRDEQPPPPVVWPAGDVRPQAGWIAVPTDAAAPTPPPPGAIRRPS